LTEIEGLGGIDEYGWGVKVCGDARQFSVGQFADECERICKIQSGILSETRNVKDKMNLQQLTTIEE